METLALPKTADSNSIQWKQLWSLAALYASIIIGWIAYSNYQPKLLTQFNFTDFTLFLVVSQAVILVLTPPIAGLIGDRYRFEQGHRLPIISSGISFAAMIFMAVAFTLFSNPGETLKWILPFLIICWLVGMSIFTSPALSTVELFTPVDKLPKAMAVLTIVSNLVYAFEPVIVDIIDFLGAPVTFIAGGVVVLISGYALKKNSLNLFKQSDNKETSMQSLQRNASYTFIFLLGLVLGIATTVMFNVFPEVFEQKLHVIFSAVNGKIGLVAMLLLSAVLSWPVSHYINRYSMRQVFWLSAILILISVPMMLFVASTWIIIITTIVFTVAFTTLSVSSLPLAIYYASDKRKVFCVGIFFSGVALPEGLFESLQVF